MRPTLFRLHLGRAIGTSGHVSDDDLRAFLARDVTPTFPGFSVTYSIGYWHGNEEASCVLEIVAQANERPKVDAIARRYCERFNQESVLVYTLRADAIAFESVKKQAA